MDPDFERKVLLDVVEQLRDPDKTMKKQTGIKKVFQAIGTTGFVVAVYIALEDLTYDVVPTLIAVMSGFFVGIAMFLNSLQKQWPVTVDYVDMQRVEARLQELDSQE